MSSKYKIKISHVSDVEMGTQSTFESRRAFSQSSLWELIKERNSSGKLTVTYYEDYRNEANFKNASELKELIGMFTEKELIDEFTKPKKG